MVLMKDKLRTYWIMLGVKMEWVSKPVCATHEGTYDFENEESRAEWDAGGDPCVPVMVLLD